MGAAGRLAFWLWIAAMVMVAAAVALLVVSRDVAVPDTWGFRGFTAIFAVGFSTVGALIVRSRRNLVGWLLLVTGLLAASQDLAEQYAIVGLLAYPGSVPGAEYAAWLESWIWVATVAIVAIYVPLFFPDGRLPSRVWAVVAIAAAILAFGLASLLAFSDGPLNNAPYVRNPLALPRSGGAGGLELPQLGTAFLVLYVSLFCCAFAGAVSVFARFRRAHDLARQQIKVFTLGAAFAVVGMIGGGALQQFKVFQVLFILAILFVPLSVAVAVLRYRLYDIDIVINRALVYGALSALLLAAFGSAVLISQAILRPITGGTEIGIALSTMITFTLVQPLRRRIQRAVDRRFYRSRYDATRTVDAFTERLAGLVDLDAVNASFVDAVARTVQPTSVSLWLRARDQRPS